MKMNERAPLAGMNNAWPLILACLFVLCSNSTQAKWLNSSFQRTTDNYVISTQVPLNILKYSRISGAPCEPISQTREGIIIFAIDHSKTTFYNTSKHYKVKFDVDLRDINGGITQTLAGKELEILYNPFDHSEVYSDKNIFIFQGAYSYTIRITSLSSWALNASPPPTPNETTFPANLYLEGNLREELYYSISGLNAPTLNAYVSNLDNESKKDEITLSWAGSPRFESYELEWTFVNDITMSPLSFDKPIDQISIATYLPDYSFSKSASRVLTKGSSFAISLIYDKGYLVYRIRGVGRDVPCNLTLGTEDVYSAWSIPVSDASVSTLSPGSTSGSTITNTQYYYVDALHERFKNWQYQLSFAEEGKTKEIIDYYDGTLRKRESVTRNNSDSLVSIGQTLYDFAGRPAINVLPTPATTQLANTHNAIKYYPNYNKEVATGYSYINFDYADVASQGCLPIAPVPMATSSGSSKYYSNQNSLMAAGKDFVNNVPDANGYPFSQTEFVPDKTGRVRSQAGVGSSFKLGSGHETKYIYDKPGQVQLDRLFGPEAGNASHYQRNAVIDANGQASISYLDEHGRVIATSLAGAKPANLQDLSTPGGTGNPIRLDLFDKDFTGNSKVNVRNDENDGIVFSRSIGVTSTSVYYLDYDILIKQYHDECMDEGICFECYYDLDITLKDECGAFVPVYNSSPVQLVNISKQVGNFELDASGNLVFHSCIDVHHIEPTIQVQLQAGQTYTLEKTLRVNHHAREILAQKYLENSNCLEPLESITNELIGQLNFDACEITCVQCVESLGSREGFVAAGKGNELEYDMLYQACMEPCKPADYCQSAYAMMLADFSLGGQYCQFREENGNYNPAKFPLSILNSSNILIANKQYSASGHTGQANWKYPIVELNGTFYPYYLDEQGQRARVKLRATTTGYAPEVRDVSLVTPGLDPDEFYTIPNNLKNVKDFIDGFQESWARSLVVYHPEYMYYKDCMGYNQKFEQDPYSSTEIDLLISSAKTYDDAVAFNLIAPKNSSLPVNERIFFKIASKSTCDPFLRGRFNLSDGNDWAGSSKLLQKFLFYKSLDGGSTHLSMAEFAAMTARCGTQYGNVIGAGCKNFGSDIGYTNEINEEFRNKEWETLRALYLSEKIKLRKERADILARNNCCKTFDVSSCSSPASACGTNIIWQYNGCIGNKSFSWPYQHMVYMLSGLPWDCILAAWQNMYYHSTSCQPCNTLERHVYDGKLQRFASVKDALQNSGNNPDANAIAYQVYMQTGLCPLAFQFSGFLGALTASMQLNNRIPTNLQRIPEFSADIYNTLYPDGPTMPYQYSAWRAINGSPTHLDGMISIGGNDLLGISLDVITGTVNWSDATAISKFSVSGTHSFTAEVMFNIGGSVVKKMVNGLLTDNSAQNKFILDGCNFSLDFNCNANDFAIDLQELLTVLSVRNPATSCLHLIKPEISSSVNSDYLPYITKNIIDALKSPPQSLNNFRWMYNSAEFAFYLVYNVNPLLPALKITFEEDMYPLLDQGYSTALIFSNIRCDYENHFVVDIYDIDNPDIRLMQVKGKVNWLGPDGEVEAVKMGTCDPPAPARCSETEHQVRKDLEKLLQDAFINKDFTAFESTNLFAMQSFTPLLKSYLPATTTHCEPWPQPQPCLQYFPGYWCAGIYFMPDGCGLRLYSDPYLHFDGDYSVHDIRIAEISDLVGIGIPDINGNYYDFEFHVRYFMSDGTSQESSVTGHSCFPIKNCSPCEDEADEFANGNGAVEGMDAIRESFGASSVIDDQSQQYYQVYLTKLQDLNNRYPSDGLATPVSYTTFFNSGYVYAIKTIVSYMERYSPPSDAGNYMSDLNDYIHETANRVNGRYEYEKYIEAVNNYNDRALVVGADFLVPKDEINFLNNLYADITPCYVMYLNSFTPAPGVIANNISASCDYQPPPGMDPCYQKYTEYVTEFIEYRDYQKTHPEICPQFLENFNIIYSFQDFIDNNLCCEPSGMANFDLLIDKLQDQNSCPLGMITLPACGSSPYINPSDCLDDYLYYSTKVEEYNNSYYANSLMHHKLNNVYPFFYSFYNAKQCNCANDYGNYLQPFIGATSNIGLPLSIEMFSSGIGGCGGQPITVGGSTEPDPCEAKYNEYMAAVVQYNDYAGSTELPLFGPPISNTLPQITQLIVNQEAFASVCHCADQYIHFLQTIVDGTYLLPPDPGTSQSFKDKLNNGINCMDLLDDPCIQNAEFVPSPIEDIYYVDPCIAQMQNIALANGQNLYHIEWEKKLTEFSEGYTDKCLSAIENFTEQFTDNEYHYTLYYYDQAGNLVKTVPPEGVEMLNVNGTAATQVLANNIQKDRADHTQTVFTEHRMASNYQFNSLNHLTMQGMPDQEKIEFWDFNLTSGLPDNFVSTAVQFVDEKTGFLSGYVNTVSGVNTARGYLFVTHDAGKRWQRMEGLLGADLEKVDMISSTVGYAIGSKGILIETMDGGNSWDLVNLYPNILTTINFKDFCVYTNTTTSLHELMSVGEQGRVVKMILAADDKFVSATRMTDIPGGVNLTSVVFDGANFWTTGYKPASTTSDGVIYYGATGSSWTVVSQFSGPDYTGISYVDQDRAYVAAKNGLLLKTTDNGTQWRLVKNNLGGNYDFEYLYFANASRGIALMTNKVSTRKEIHVTGDGGRTWSLFSDPNVSYTSLSFVQKDVNPVKNGVAVTSAGKLERILMDANTSNSGTFVNKMTLNAPSIANASFKFMHASIAKQSSSGMESLQQLNSLKTYVLALGTRTETSPPSSNVVAYYAEITGQPGTTWHELAILSPIVPAGTSYPASTFIRINNGIEGWVGFKDASNMVTSKLFKVSTDHVIENIVTPACSTVWSESFCVNPFDITTFIGNDQGNGNLYKYALSPPVCTLATTLPLEVKSLDCTSQHILAAGVGGSVNRLSTGFSQTDQSKNIVPAKLNDIKYVTNGTTKRLLSAGDDGYLYSCNAVIPNPVFGILNPAFDKPVESINAVACHYNPVDFKVKGVVAGDKGNAFVFTLGDISTSVFASASQLALNTDGDLLDVCYNAAGNTYWSGSTGTMHYCPDVFATLPVLTRLVSAVADTLQSICIIPGAGTKAIAAGKHSAVYKFISTTTAKVIEIFPAAVSKVHFADGNMGSIVGSNFTVRRTTDGGNSWITIIPKEDFASSANIPELKSVFTFSNGDAIAVGDKSTHVRIHATNPDNENDPNNEKIDRPAVCGTCLTYNDVSFTDNSNGFIVGGNGSSGYYKATVNGGSEWTVQPTLGTSPINALQAFKSPTGFSGFIAVGNNSVIKVLQETGMITPTTTVTDNLRDVFVAADFRTCYAVGDAGTLLRCKIDKEEDIHSEEAVDFIWTKKSLSDDTVITISNSSNINISVIGFSSPLDGFVGGLFTSGFTPSPNATYARRLHDEPSRFSSQFWYDRLGRLILSRNTKQYKADPKRYSYTLYDAQGRIIEVGEKTDNVTSTTVNGRFKSTFGSLANNTYNSDAIDPAKFLNWLAGTGLRTEVTRMYYDQAKYTLPPPFTQENLRQRVASTIFQDTYEATGNNYNSATHYSYDVHGNVKSLLQDNPALTGSYVGHRYKQIDYSFDLISGKVNDVHYQNLQYDAFHHHYEYDSENRLTEAYTSTYPGAHWVNQVGDPLWDKDAKYYYFPHGPLARVEIGDTKAQGIDYAYTLQGWLKGVNSNTLVETYDIGRDGTPAKKAFAKDAFGYSLGYFNNDFKAIASPAWAHFEAVTTGSDFLAANKDLYNGNISSMVTAIRKIDQAVLPLASAFQYDQLNRIKQSLSFNNVSGNLWGTGSANPNMYKSTYSYDANGNINTLVRHDASGVKFDDMTYQYKNPAGKMMSNRLYQVHDGIASSVNTNDIDDQDYTLGHNLDYDPSTDLNTKNNYRYDELGNLTEDVTEGIYANGKITWTLTGKIKGITRATGSTKDNLAFQYDPSGNRISKTDYKFNSTTSAWVIDNTTYYVRDAQGNIMATYVQSLDGSTAHYKLQEQELYGSFRLGNYQANFELLGLSGTPPLFNTTALRTLDQKNYELTNHLGNVQAVISPRKTPVGTGSTIDYYQPDMITATDYYPFGMIMPGRQFAAQLCTTTTTILTSTVYVMNEDFNNGVVVWTAIGTSVVTPNSQRMSIAKGSGNNNVATGALKSFAVTSGTAYTVTSLVDKNSCSTILITVKNQSGTAICSTTVSTSGVIPIALSFTAATAATYSITFERTAGGNCSFFVDDVKISYIQSTYDTVCFDRGYRFGYNDQEKTDEISGGGNHNTAMFWEYDTRLGRRWNIDPKVIPGQSSYAAFDNNPIYFKDVKGKTGEAYIQGDDVIIESKFYFYGTAITQKKADAIAAEIENNWNSANGKVTIDGKQYNVKFKVTAVAVINSKNKSDAEYTADIAKLATENDRGGSNYKDNYVRIDDTNEGQRASEGYEISETPGEVGYWLNDEIYSQDKTSSHEYGEGLGLEHPRNPLWNGVLRIMAGKKPGRDASQRQVTQGDIDDLDLATKLNGVKPGEKVGLGVKKFEYYEKGGDIIYNSSRIGEK